MSFYTSNKGTFTYTITNNTSYVVDSSDNDIIQSAFDRWDEIITIDSRFGDDYTINISFNIDVLDIGVLGGASIQMIAYIDNVTFSNTLPYTGDIT